jgi:hypothetical protein
MVTLPALVPVNRLYTAKPLGLPVGMYTSDPFPMDPLLLVAMPRTVFGRDRPVVVKNLHVPSKYT